MDKIIDENSGHLSALLCLEPFLKVCLSTLVSLSNMLALCELKWHSSDFTINSELNKESKLLIPIRSAK